MKVLQSSIFRAICSIIVGILLIKYPTDTMTGITICIGVLFLLPGVFSLITYWSSKRNECPEQVLDSEGNVISGGKPIFPIVGLGSVILGLFLALMPATFVSILMYVLGAILVLGAINQFIVLINVKKIGKVSWGFYVLPSLILLTGLFVLLYPMESASIPLIIIGYCCLIFGITECINAFNGYRLRKENKDL